MSKTLSVRFRKALIRGRVLFRLKQETCVSLFGLSERSLRRVESRWRQTGSVLRTNEIAGNRRAHQRHARRRLQRVHRRFLRRLFRVDPSLYLFETETRIRCSVSGFVIGTVCKESRKCFLSDSRSENGLSVINTV